ncbi:DUF2867 domain-containing protein [Teredinibacter sp. KSP-S5-2]|uniref:DUF2867 domain-containing protein n=1 Tax=Teredinibacter sp. KSP-S5-2 TaxID=3034506 RepID=UPI00293521EC|nr:DUF2867 domain-containing protein [Teredinibacter sp. KSP-S5-2]WNO09557.1 DUF2867 domain-containing protein [Teredinibacter sp. KSP-S5-2]
MTQDTDKRVLVLGASGYIGTYLTPELAKKGFTVRASARNKEVLAAREWNEVELVEADALSPHTLNKALTGIDTVFYLIHSMASGKKFAEIDKQAAQNFAKAAKEKGVKKVIYLGGLIPNDPKSEHLKSRAETGEILRSSGIPIIEVRAGMIVGPGSAAFEVIRDLVNYLPLMITPHWVQSKTTPIALKDLLHYLTAIAEKDFSHSETYDVGGSETLTYEQMMRTYGRIAQKSFSLIRVPILSPKLSSYWLRLVTSVPTNIARALIDGLAHDIIANNSKIKKIFPHDLLSFEEAVQDALNLEKNGAKLAHWVEGSYVCRNYDFNHAYYAKRAGHEITTHANRESLWQAVQEFGGEQGFYFAENLWFIRRAIDWPLGGPSFRRRRRDNKTLRVGDVIDSWRVIGLEPKASLTLRMEMKAPGSGVLEFKIREHQNMRSLSVTAYWHPAGPAGIAYWYACLPAHAYLFEGLVHAIEKRAIDLET